MTKQIKGANQLDSLKGTSAAAVLAGEASLFTFSCVPGFSMANTSSTNTILVFSNGIRSFLYTPSK